MRCLLRSDIRPTPESSEISSISTKPGYIVSPDGTSTNIDGVFVAGDVNDLRYKQAITASARGCRAAMDAEKYLEALEFAVTEAAI